MIMFCPPVVQTVASHRPTESNCVLNFWVRALFVCERRDRLKGTDNGGLGDPERGTTRRSHLINRINKRTVLHFNYIFVDREREREVQAGGGHHLRFMQEGHLEASLLTLSLLGLVLVANEQDATTWHEVQLFPQNTSFGDRSETVRWSERENEWMKVGKCLSPQPLWGEHLCAWVMHSKSALCWTHTQRAPSASQHRAVLCAALVSFIMPRCRHDQDLRLFKLIMQMSTPSPTLPPWRDISLSTRKSVTKQRFDRGPLLVDVNEPTYSCWSEIWWPGM